VEKPPYGLRSTARNRYSGGRIPIFSGAANSVRAAELQAERAIIILRFILFFIPDCTNKCGVVFARALGIFDPHCCNIRSVPPGSKENERHQISIIPLLTLAVRHKRRQKEVNG
jgi:hypothetical protein